MNRENISRLILDAGNGDEEWAIIAKQLHKHFPDELERFAALVASAEREECAYRAGIALLGADRGLANRVDQAIQARDKHD